MDRTHNRIWSGLVGSVVMRRGGLIIALLALAVSACSRNSTGTTGKGVAPGSGDSDPFRSTAIRRGNGNQLGGTAADNRPKPPGPTELFPAASAVDLRRQPFATAAFRIGLEFLAAHRYEEAWSSFAAIGQVDPVTQSLMARSKHQSERETIAAAIANDIQAILDDNKPDAAAELAVKTLRQFGETDSAERLLTLKRQADALIDAALESTLEVANPPRADAKRQERINDLRQQAEKEQDKRLALLDLEHAVQLGGNDEVKSAYIKASQELCGYDEALARAARLRKTPAGFDDALAALGDARKIWDTKAIRDQIEILRWQLLVRRDRLAVVDFESLGNVGISGAGALVAEELQSAFSERFDLQNRKELNEAISALKLRTALAASDNALREVGRLVRTRYLITGSIEPVAGLTVQAQMVDTRSGMIVHTARMVVPNAGELVQRLPQLAAELLVADEDRELLDLKRADAATAISVASPLGAPVPLPDLDPKLQPASIIPAWPKPPSYSGLTAQQLNTLPPPPPLGQISSLPVIPIERDQLLRGRALAAAIELGDNLFRRRLFHQALARYEYAMSLAPERADVRRRIDECRSHMPPSAIAPADGRARLAILDFLAPEVAKLAPSNLGTWVPESLAPYSAAEYRNVDRAEVFWWMGRLGISVPEALNDFLARQYLSRALDVRYFLVGSVAMTDGVDVTTYLVDAERGFVMGSGRTMVREGHESKLRLHSLRGQLKELAERTMMSPEQRREAEGQDCERDLLLNDVRREMANPGGLSAAIDLCRKWLKVQPDNVQVLLILSDAEHRLEIQEVFDSRQPDIKYSSERMSEIQRNYLALAQDARRIRLDAARESSAVPDTERRRMLARRKSSAASVLALAQSLIDSHCASVAKAVCDAAIRLSSDQTVIDRLTSLCEKMLVEAKVEQDDLESQKGKEMRRQRDNEIQAARLRSAADRVQRDAVLAARQRTSEERTRRESVQLLALAHQLDNTRQYDEALAATQIVLHLQPSAQIKEFANELLLKLARVNAESRGTKAKEELERDLAAEQAARRASEANAEKTSKLFDQTMADGRRLLRDGKLDDAEAKFRKAREIYDTDAVLAELQQVKVAKELAESIEKGSREAEVEHQRRNDALKAKMSKATAAGQRFDEAIALWLEARAIDPSSAEAFVGLLRARSARDAYRTQAFVERAEIDRRRSSQALLAGGRKDLTRSKFVAAVAFGTIVRMYPDSQEAAVALAEAQQQFGTESTLAFPDNSLAEQFRNAVRDGCWYRVAGLYERAREMFRIACGVLSDEYAANEFERETEKLVKDIEEARKVAIVANMHDINKADQMKMVLDHFYVALAAGDLTEAEQDSEEALRLDKDDPGAVRGQNWLRQLRAIK